MLKRAMYSSVFLALAMSVLAPTRFATIHLCNTAVFESGHAQRAVETVAPKANYGVRALQRKKISVADFSIVAGLEVGGETHLPPCVQAVPNLTPLPDVIFSDCEHVFTYVSVDLLSLHSRRNI